VTRNQQAKYIYLLRRRRKGNGNTGTGSLAARLLLGLALGLGLLALLTVASGVGAAVAAYGLIARELPAPEQITQAAASFKSTKIYDRTGQHLLYEIFDPHGGKRTWVSLEDIPPYVKQATIAIEDKDFYTNPGFDFRRLVRSVYATLIEGRREGASTITQQLVKNVLLTPEVSIERKVKEILLAIEISRRYSKDEILEMYLNEINYGNLSYGIEAAAESYFGKQAKDLTLAEAALLAGLPQAPSGYSPFTNLSGALARRALVLDAMYREGYIDALTAWNAKQEKPRFARQRFDITAPHFVFYVRELLESRYGADLVYRGGLSVYTTIDLDLQRLAEQAAREQIEKIRKSNNANNAAVVALKPDTGEILAMVGSVDYFDNSIDGQVNMATAERQPGSAFKPFAYVTAFGAGDLRDADGKPKPPLTPATMVMDVRTSFDDRPNPPYIPENVDGKWRGPLRLRTALALSENIPAIKVTQYAGVKNTLATAHRMGITTLTNEQRYGLSITLGGGEVKLLDMTFAYAIFANGGFLAGTPRAAEEIKPGYRELDPVSILKIVDANGNIVEEYREPEHREVIKPPLAYLISSMLSDNQARFEVIGDALNLPSRRPAAAKTGTTTDWRDNWTVGYTPELVVGVWVGNANNEEMIKSYGSTAAAPIWRQVMEEAYKQVAPFQDIPPHGFAEPPGLERAEVCAVSGLKATPYCPHKVTEVFVQGTVPTETCNVHQPFKIDKTNGKLATPYTPPQDIEERVFEIYPPEAADWLQEAQIPQPPSAYSERGAPGVAGVGSGDVGLVSPTAFSYVRGIVPIIGNARSQNFKLYKLEFGQGLGPTSWMQIGPEHYNQVSNGWLENWDTTGFNGVYTLQLSVVAHSGHWQQASLPVTVDNISPTVKITYPITKEVFYYDKDNPDKLRIQAEATDNAAMGRVEFYLDGQALMTSTVPPYNMLWPIVMTTTITDTKIIVTETHTIYAIAYDAAGNQQKSEEVVIQVATEPPKPPKKQGWLWREELMVWLDRRDWTWG